MGNCSIWLAFMTCGPRAMRGKYFSLLNDGSLHSSEVAYPAVAYAGFYRAKRLGVSLLPPWMGCQSFQTSRPGVKRTNHHATVYPIWQLNFTTFVMMKTKKLRASDWLETSTFSCNTNAKLSHECPIKICLS